MEEKIKARAKELYKNNCGYKSRLTCAKEAIAEYKTNILKELAFFDITDKDLDNYALYISQTFKGRG